MTILETLTERQRQVVATMRMRLTRAQALAYLHGQGYPMSGTTYGRIKSWLKRTEDQRLRQIAALGYESQLLARVDNCEHIEQLMWKDYFLEKNAYKRVMILKEIKDLQLYITTYYAATRSLIEKQVIKIEPANRREDVNNNTARGTTATLRSEPWPVPK